MLLRQTSYWGTLGGGSVRTAAVGINRDGMSLAMAFWIFVEAITELDVGGGWLFNLGLWDGDGGGGGDGGGRQADEECKEAIVHLVLVESQS